MTSGFKVSHPPGCYDYDKVTDGTAAQNIGTSDHIVHDYWHYYDIPFSPDGEETDPAPAVNALTQIRLLKAALSEDKSTDDLKCYDLVWLLHLVGDAHQPLHAFRGSRTSSKAIRVVTPNLSMSEASDLPNFISFGTAF